MEVSYIVSLSIYIERYWVFISAETKKKWKFQNFKPNFEEKASLICCCILSICWLIQFIIDSILIAVEFVYIWRWSIWINIVFSYLTVFYTFDFSEILQLDLRVLFLTLEFFVSRQKKEIGHSYLLSLTLLLFYPRMRREGKNIFKITKTKFPVFGMDSLDVTFNLHGLWSMTCLYILS